MTPGCGGRAWPLPSTLRLGWTPRVPRCSTLGLCSREGRTLLPHNGPWSQRAGLSVGVRAWRPTCARPGGHSLVFSVSQLLS